MENQFFAITLDLDQLETWFWCQFLQFHEQQVEWWHCTMPLVAAILVFKMAATIFPNVGHLKPFCAITLDLDHLETWFWYRFLHFQGQQLEWWHFHKAKVHAILNFYMAAATKWHLSKSWFFHLTLDLHELDTWFWCPLIVWGIKDRNGGIYRFRKDKIYINHDILWFQLTSLLWGHTNIQGFPIP